MRIEDGGSRDCGLGSALRMEDWKIGRFAIFSWLCWFARESYAVVSGVWF